MDRQATAKVRATQGQPCQVCGSGTKGCSVQADGLHRCRGAKGPVRGFKYLGQADRDREWGLYRSLNDPLLHANNGNGHKNGSSAARSSRRRSVRNAKDWLPEVEKYKGQLTYDLKAELADALGLPLSCLDAVPSLGWHPRGPLGPCWTWPEYNGRVEIVGISWRNRNGEKGMLKGGNRGLVTHPAWQSRDDHIFVVEGFSDFLAMTTMGLTSIARPNNICGAGDLAELLSQEAVAGVQAFKLDGVQETQNGCQPDLAGETDNQAAAELRPIVIMGEHDCKPNGDWPGLAGCKSVAEELQTLLGRMVTWALPAHRAKDVREWFKAEKKDVNIVDDLHRVGGVFISRLEVNPVTSKEKAAEEDTLDVTSASDVPDELIDWLVEGYVPKRMITLFAGEGGVGKSMLIADLASRLSQGDCWLDKPYVAPERCDTLWVNCEDGLGDTIKARLRAARADLDRVHFPNFVRKAGGKAADFGLDQLPALENFLVKNPDIRLVVIDPVDAHLGDTGVDDCKTAALKSLLKPLKLLAERRNVAIVLILNFNKGESTKVTNRIAGSAAYRNTCRVVFVAMENPDLPGNYVFDSVKINAADKPEPMAYKIATIGDGGWEEIIPHLNSGWSMEQKERYRKQLAHVVWKGKSDVTSKSICLEEASQVQQAPNTAARAAEWLRSFLGSGPKLATECHVAGNLALGLSRPAEWWRENVLTDKLNGYSQRESAPKPRAFWCLPGQNAPRKSENACIFPENAENAENAENVENGGGV